MNQACAVLKAVVDAGGASADDDDDEETKARAVENAANAVAAVADALYAPDSTERQQLVGWWLGALPFEEDDEEARRAHRTLVNGLERGDPALRAHLPLVTARLADALSTLEGSPPSSPTKPCETPLDSNTAQRAVRALKGVNAEQPAVIQSAYAGLMKPAQEALQKARWRRPRHSSPLSPPANRAVLLPRSVTGHHEDHSAAVVVDDLRRPCLKAAGASLHAPPPTQGNKFAATAPGMLVVNGRRSLERSCVSQTTPVTLAFFPPCRSIFNATN